MKKLFYNLCLVALCLLPGQILAQAETTFSFGQLDIKAGQTKDLVVNLDNPDMEVWMMQFDMQLSEGLEVEMDADGTLVMVETDRIPRTHILDGNRLSDGTYRFLIYTTKKATLTGNSGALFTISVVAAEDFKSGTISATNILVTNLDNDKFALENYTLTIEEKVDIPVTVTVNDATRKYGEANPEFAYTVTPADVDLTGKVTLTCEADAKSSVGEYAITATAAEVEGMVITCENGKLTVTPALLKVIANDATRYVGEANPELTLTYEGFVNDEDESVLIVAPKATTAATEESEAGTYEITVSGGEAANYEFEYKSGTLTILAVDGIDTILVDGRTLGNVYDLKGRLVRSAGTSLEGLTKGVYVVSGRKVVLK